MDAKAFVEKVTEISQKAIEAAQEALNAATPEERKVLEGKIRDKAKAQVKQEERDNALDLLISTVKAIAADDVDLMAACKLLTKTPRVAGQKTVRVSAPRVSRFAVLDQLFPEIGTIVNDNAIFAEFKMGPKEMHWLIADAIKGAKDPADRKWIDFDPASGNYTFVSQGAEPPEGWTGYVPKALRLADNGKVIEPLEQ